uniref:Deuterosome assembly protein 1 n=1 Tax=Saimiri boliviensis boliviensis TaxID=39432 RepID=A0A2K6TKZ4_SAIBB
MENQAHNTMGLKSKASISTCLPSLSDWTYASSLENASASLKKNSVVRAVTNLSS